MVLETGQKAGDGGAAAESATPPDMHFRVFAELLARFAEIVGDGAGYATFHFAAVQQGIRHAREHEGKELDVVLDLAHAGLGNQGAADIGDRKVTLRLERTPLLSGGANVSEGVLLGFYEGILRATRGATYDGVLTRSGESVLIELTRKGA